MLPHLGDERPYITERVVDKTLAIAISASLKSRLTLAEAKPASGDGEELPRSCDVEN